MTTEQEPLLSFGYDGSQPLESRGTSDNLSWWKRPSPWWLLIPIPILLATASIILAPAIEVFTDIACQAHRPELYAAIPRDCMNDAKVRATVATLAAASTMTSGLLGCVTTSWWSSLSDRLGRAPLLTMASFGLFLSTALEILAIRFWKVLPGGYWFLLVGPICDGLLGGIMTILSTLGAYIADTSTESESATYLSISYGFQFGGMALGPVIGGLAIHFSGQVISTYYTSCALRFLFALFVFFVVPESLSKTRMVQAREARALLKINSTSGSGISTWAFLRYPAAVWQAIRDLFHSLAVLAPVEKKDGNPLKKPTKDYSLLLLVSSFGCLCFISNVVPYVFQYTAITFGWTSEENGYWSSLAFGTRGLWLSVLLPVILKVVKTPSRSRHTMPTRQQLDAHVPEITDKTSSSLDLRLARWCLSIEFGAYLFSVLLPTPITLFMLAVFSSVGSGYVPVIQGVMLFVYKRNGGTEVGALFGAISFIQGFCALVISPALYGLIFVKTIATFPLGIFVASLVNIGSSLIILGFVRLPQDDPISRDTEVIRDFEDTPL